MANKVPDIRFEGFEGEWSNYILTDIARKRKVLNAGLAEKNLLSLSYGKIKRKNIETKKGLLPSSFSSYQIIEDGTIVFRFTDLQNDQKSLRVGLSHEKGIVSSAYVCVDPDKDVIIPQFLYWLLHYYDINKVFYRMGDGIRQSISYDDLTEMNLTFPNYEEQNVLSLVMDSIDGRIMEQEELCKKLKSLKTAMLYSLFPQESKYHPNIRIEGFSEDWRVVRLGDIADKVIDKNSRNALNLVYTNSAEFGIIPQSQFFDKKIANDNNLGGYFILEKDDFVYNPRISVTAPVGPINRNVNDLTGIVSPLYFVFRTHDVHPSFLSWYFKTTLWHKYMRFNGNVGARHDRFSIKETSFLNMPIVCPSIEEQKAISSVLNEYDRLIQLNEQKLEKLRNLKQAMLDKMFV